MKKRSRCIPLLRLSNRWHEYNGFTLGLDFGGRHETNDFCTRMRFRHIAHGREKFKPSVCAHVCWLPPIGYEVPATVPNLARMEQVIQSFVADKQFMGAVLVARENDVLLNKGYGFANLEWNIPDSPKTKFRLGSITKQFTAASILLLEERGKLEHQRCSEEIHAGQLPAASGQITIFHLLTHTSGIPSFTSFPDYAKLEPFSATPGELVTRFRDKPLDFPAGGEMELQQFGIRPAGIPN